MYAAKTITITITYGPVGSYSTYETRASVMNPRLPHTYIEFVFITETLVTRYFDVRIAEEPPLTKGNQD